MDSETNEKIMRYTELVKQHIPVEMIVLYGSYARGTAQKDSDIDIAVVVEDLKGDILEINADLFTLTRAVDFRIEPKLIIRKNNSSGSLESILKYGKIIYHA